MKREHTGINESEGVDDVSSKKKKVFQRNFDHVDGNWPSHVYLLGNFRKGRFLSLRKKLITNFMKLCDDESIKVTSSSSAVDSVVIEDDPHISLSKPFVLRKHQIGNLTYCTSTITTTFLFQPLIISLMNSSESFVNNLNESLGVMHLAKFKILFDKSGEVLINDSKTRLFVVVPVNTTVDNGVALRSLNAIVKVVFFITCYARDYYEVSLAYVQTVDEALALFKQPIYYKVSMSSIFFISY